jgi:hypothetical protein
VRCNLDGGKDVDGRNTKHRRPKGEGQDIQRIKESVENVKQDNLHNIQTNKTHPPATAASFSKKILFGRSRLVSVSTQK